MFTHLLASVENFFENPEVRAFESFVGKNLDGLMAILSAAGVKHSAVASAILKDVVATSTTGATNEEKLAAVTNGVIQLGGLIGSSHLQNPLIAGVVAETAFQAVKAAGALGAPAPVAAPVPTSTVAVAYQQPAVPEPIVPVTTGNLGAVASTMQAFPEARPVGVLSTVTGIPRNVVTPIAPSLVAGG